MDTKVMVDTGVTFRAPDSETRTAQQQFLALKQKIKNGSAVVAVCGLGYVGLPLVRAIASKGYRILGFDTDLQKVEQLNSGQSYIAHIPAAEVRYLIDKNCFLATSDFSRIKEADIVIICVPTPLTKYREPDLSYVVGTTKSIAQYARPGQLVILESTTYPGTTAEILAPIFFENLLPGQDVFLAFSPEREDPGNPNYETSTIPKVVGADGSEALELAVSFYQSFIRQVVPVSTSKSAEAIKLTENIFRAVNIALVNELKVIYAKMGIDIWEVIEAAKTKPFGFMPFYPGPGLGGHCIPIDPFYLTWKAREYGIATRLIETAGEINTAMPSYVVAQLAEELDRRTHRGLSGARILLVGLAYKKNVDDVRESPALKLMEILEKRGATVCYYDPFVSVIPMTREHPDFSFRQSIAFDVDTFDSFDAALIATDHDSVDYHALVEHCKFVVDTRNVCQRFGIVSDKIAKA